MDPLLVLPPCGGLGPQGDGVAEGENIATRTCKGQCSLGEGWFRRSLGLRSLAWNRQAGRWVGAGLVHRGAGLWQLGVPQNPEGAQRTPATPHWLRRRATGLWLWGRGRAAGRGVGVRDRPGSREAGFRELAPRGAGLQQPRDPQFGLPAPQYCSYLHSGGPVGSPGVGWPLGLGTGSAPPLPPSVGPRRSGPRDMEPTPATGGLETTRLVSPRDRGGAGGGLRLKR